VRHRPQHRYRMFCVLVADRGRSSMENLNEFTARLRREEDRKYALMVTTRHMDPRLPARLIKGVVVSGAQRNSNGHRFNARGLSIKLPVPLCVAHDLAHPIGLVTGIEIFGGDEIRFSASLCNSAAAHGALEAWDALIEQRDLMACSMSARSIAGKPVGGLYSQFEIDEISLTHSGSDAGTRVLRVFERAPYIRADRPTEVTFWSKEQ